MAATVEIQTQAETAQKPQPGVRRVNVNFSHEAFEMLQSLARRKGTTMSEVLRDAIGLEDWFDETWRSGGRVLVERNGTVHEILSR